MSNQISNWDVIIIGGGIVGVSLAHELAPFDVKILLLEKEAELSFGVSKSNSGIIHTGFQGDHRTLKGKLAVRGNQLYGKLSQKLQFPIKRVGEIVVGRDSDKPKLEAIQKNAELLEIPGVSLKNRAWIDSHEPALKHAIRWALLGETAGVVNPYEVIYAMAENAMENGVSIQCNENVERISQAEQLWTVKTTQSEFQTKCVINAAGLFSDEVAGMAHIQVPKIYPRKGEEFLLDRHIQNLPARIVFPVPTKTSKGILIIPTVENNYMIGPTAMEIEDKTDLSTSTYGKNQVLNHISQLVDGITESAIITSFSGLRPAIKSGDFYIQEDRPGFINAVGIQSPGLTAAPAIAEYIRKLVENTSSLIPKKSYAYTRKAIPRFRDLSVLERNQLIKQNSDYGQMVCRCEQITKAEIIEAIQRGARTLDGVKFRTRSQMGRCHGAFCTAKIMAIMKQELGISYQEITKRGKGTELVV